MTKSEESMHEVKWEKDAAVGTFAKAPRWLLKRIAEKVKRGEVIHPDGWVEIAPGITAREVKTIGEKGK